MDLGSRKLDFGSLESDQIQDLYLVSSERFLFNDVINQDWNLEEIE